MSNFTTHTNTTDIVSGSGVTLSIFLALIAIVTAFGNLLVILAVVLVKKLRTPSNLLIVSLAVSDFLVGILAIPFAGIQTVVTDWPLGESLCDLYIAFDVLLCTSSILNLCAISIDRYLAITKPLRYAARRTPGRMVGMIAITWIASALICIPPMFGFKEPFVPGSCLYSSNIIYQIYATCSAFYIPLVVMVVLYGRIFILARRMAQDLARQIRAAEAAVSMHSSNYHPSSLPINPGDQSVIGNSVKLRSSSITDQNPQQFDGNHSTKIDKTQQPTERYPLPPSVLCRRNKPRQMTASESRASPERPAVVAEPRTISVYTLSPTAQNPITELTSKQSASSLIQDFEQRVERNRHLRSEFYSSPPSRQGSILLLNDKSSTANLHKADAIHTAASDCHPFALYQSQSMRDSEKPPIAPSQQQSAFKKPPKLSISYYPDETGPLLGQEEEDRKLSVDNSSPLIESQMRKQIPRPRRRPMHGTRQSMSGVSSDPSPHKRHDSNSTTNHRSTVLGLPLFSLDRRSSSPILNHFRCHRASIESSRQTTQTTAQADEPAEEAEALTPSLGTLVTVTPRKRTHSRISMLTHVKKRRSRGHSESKAIKTLGVIMGCFILCWLPFFIIALVAPIYKVRTGEDLHVPDSARSFILWLGYINSTINPIIYAIFNREFRLPFREILFCRCRHINARLRSQRYAVEYGLPVVGGGQTSLGDNGGTTVKRRPNTLYRNTLDIDASQQQPQQRSPSWRSSPRPTHGGTSVMM